MLVADAAPTKFLTLTCSSRTHPDRTVAFATLRAAWPLLVKRLRRYHAPEPVEYFWVLEATRRGYPHYHVALRMPYTPQRLLSRWWGELTSSFVVDIRAVSTPREGSWELTKYLTKRLFAPPGYRRWSSSKGFLREPFRPPTEPVEGQPGWRVEQQSTGSLATLWRSDLYAVLTLDDGEIYGARTVMARRSVLSDLRHHMDSRAPPATPSNKTAELMIMLAAASAEARGPTVEIPPLVEVNARPRPKAATPPARLL